MRVLFLLFVLALIALLVWTFIIGPSLARRRAARAPWVVRFKTVKGGRQVLLVRGHESEVFGSAPPREQDPFDAFYEELKDDAEREARDRNKMLKSERRL